MCGRFGGNSIDILPENFMWAGSDAVAGTCSILALEKPPMSASDIVLHIVMVSGSVKSRRWYGVMGIRMDSRVVARDG